MAIYPQKGKKVIQECVGQQQEDMRTCKIFKLLQKLTKKQNLFSLNSCCCEWLHWFQQIL